MMSSTGDVKNKTKESLVLQHVRSSYCSGHSWQPAALFETDKSGSNMAASVIYNKSEDATTGLSLGCRALLRSQQSHLAAVYKWLQCFRG